MPYADIIEFLKIHNQNISNDKDENYTNAWVLININPGMKVSSVAIIDFIIAYNLAIRGVQSDLYKSSTILLAKDNDLIELA